MAGIELFFRASTHSLVRQTIQMPGIYPYYEVQVAQNKWQAKGSLSAKYRPV